MTESIKNETSAPALPQQANVETDSSIDKIELVADVSVISDLRHLESYFSNMMTDTREDLKKCDIEEIKFYLDDYFGVDEFQEYYTIDGVLRKLRCDYIGTFNIRVLQSLVGRFHQSEDIVVKIKEYEDAKEEFFRSTAVKEFQRAVVNKAEALLPERFRALTIIIPKEYGVPRTMNDVEELAVKGFKGRYKDLVRIFVMPDSSSSSNEEEILLKRVQQKGENKAMQGTCIVLNLLLSTYICNSNNKLSL